MPHVPIVERKTETRALATGQTGPMLSAPRLSLPSAPDTSSLIAGTMQNRVKALDNVADALSDVAVQAKRKGDQMAVIESQRKLDDWERSTLFDPAKGALNKKGKDALGLPDSVGASYDAYSQGIYDNLTNDDQKLAFSQMAVSRRDTVLRTTLRHERQEMDLYAKSETEAAVESGIDRAQNNYQDPVAVENSINNAKGAFTAYARTQGMPEDAITVKNKEIERKARMGVLGRMALEDPDTLLSGVEKRNNPTDGFESAVSWVLQKEGGYVSNDAGRGPTKFGINSEANPGVDIESLTVPQAKEIYKEKYWKAIGAESLPPAMAMAAFDAAVNHGVGKAKEMLEASGGDAGKFLDLREAEYRRLAEANPEKYGKHLDGWLNRLDDLAATGGGASGIPSFDVLQWDDQRQIINAAEGRLRQLQTQRRADLEGRMKDASAMSLAGVKVPNPPAQEDFIRAYGAEDGGQRFQRFSETQHFAAAVNEVATQTPAQQMAALEAIKPPEGEGFAERQKEYETLGKAIIETNKQRQDDPIAFAIQKGLTDEDAPLNLSNFDTLVSQMHQRADTSAVMHHLYGTPVRAFTKPEAEQLKTFLSTAQPEQQFAIVSALYQGYGDKLPEAIEPIADKDKIFAHYAGLAAADPERGPSVALDAFRGRAIMTQNPKASPSQTNALPIFQETVGNAFQYLPAAEAALYDSANALYVKRAYDAGKIEQFDGDLFEQSVHDALGARPDSTAIAKINDRYTVLPVGVDDGKFEDFLSSLTPEDMQEFSPSGSPPMDGKARMIRPEALASYGQFINVGNGMYKIKLPDGFVKTGDGVNDYVLFVTPDRVRKVLAR